MKFNFQIHNNLKKHKFKLKIIMKQKRFNKMKNKINKMKIKNNNLINKIIINLIICLFIYLTFNKQINRK